MIIKVCGLTENQNTKDILNTPIDWIGINFYPSSSRYIGDRYLYKGNKLLVGVFVNADIDTIIDKVKSHRLDIIQLHGDEDNEYCKQVKDLTGLGVIKAVGIENRADVASTNQYTDVDYLLFDKKSRFYGGSGQKFDWTLLEQYEGEKPFIVAGGIGPEDIGYIFHLTSSHFAGVDVNSQFEIEPGIKDATKINSFANRIKYHESNN